MSTQVVTEVPTTVAVAARAVDAVKVYGSGATEVRALDGINVEFAAGRWTAIMGPSGSGKSTLLHCMAGLDTLTSGAVFIGDTDLTTLDDRRLTLLRREQVGFVFQSFNLVPTLTAEENITLPLALGGRQVDPEWLHLLVNALHLEDRLHHRPSELSGGQQQRVAAARAMVTRPVLIFADEPTGNLDSKSATEMLEMTRAAVEGFGQTVVMVTHDARAASSRRPGPVRRRRSDRAPDRAPHDERDPRRAQAPGSVSDVQDRVEVHARQEAAPRQHRVVGDPRSRIPRGHARVHRHDQAHVRRSLCRRLRRTPIPTCGPRAPSISAWATSSGAVSRTRSIDTVRHVAGVDDAQGIVQGFAQLVGVRWRGDRQPGAGRADVRHELRVRADEPVAAHRRQPAARTGRAADRQGQRRQGRLRDRRHRHRAHPNRSARVPARRHGPVRHGRLARWRKCLRLRPGDRPGRVARRRPTRSTP